MSRKLNYQDLLHTEFFQFFNCKEISSTKEGSVTIKKIKTGGFQEFIELNFHVNEEEEIIEANLILDRTWVGNEENLNPFAKDITKSFVEIVCPPANEEEIEELVVRIFHQKGSKDKVIALKDIADDFGDPPLEIQKILEVFKGKHPLMYYMLFSSMYVFENKEIDNKMYLTIKWKSL